MDKKHTEKSTALNTTNNIPNNLQIFEKYCNKMVLLYKSKNNNYGDSFSKLYKKYGNVALMVPITNKFNRLEQLMENPDSNCFESIEDTLIDLASYCIMALVEKSDEHTKPADEESHESSDRTLDPIWVVPHDTLPNYTPNYGPSHEACADCSFYKTLKSGGTYVGDTPCTWCRYNVAWCSTTTSGNNWASINKSEETNKDKKKEDK